LRHEARGDVDAVAQEIAVRLQHNVTQVHANAHLRFARFGEFECCFDSGKARAKVQSKFGRRKESQPFDRRADIALVA
jgi:hypothetical protein